MKRRRQQAADISVHRVPFSEFISLWHAYGERWRWRNPFTTPPWLLAWWRHFGGDSELYLLKISKNAEPVGVAPLMVRNGVARLIGSNDLCDHGDFVIETGAETLFCTETLRFLLTQGVHRVVLQQVRKDSRVYRGLLPIARTKGWSVSVAPQAVAVQMDLPGSWEEYLQRLKNKQRHEARRKLRRASDAGAIDLHMVTDVGELSASMDSFMDLFRQSRADKREFMTDAREDFFRSLAEELAQFGMLHLLLLLLDGKPAAALFCVENGGTMYLYNNGFDPRFRDISLGVVSKLHSIRLCIEKGVLVYDFLSGNERYKYQLGGTDMPLVKCVIQHDRFRS